MKRRRIVQDPVDWLEVMPTWTFWLGVIACASLAWQALWWIGYIVGAVAAAWMRAHGGCG